MKKSKVDKSLSAKNRRSTYYSGMKTGNYNGISFKSDPVRCDNFVRANPDKYAHGHPAPSTEVPKRTANPVFPQLKGKVLSAR